MTPESRAREKFLSTATSTFNNCILCAAQVPEAPMRRVFSAECASQPRQNLFQLALVLPALDLNLSSTLTSFVKALSKIAVNVGSGGRQSFEVLSHRRCYVLRIGAREGDVSEIKQHARASTNLIFPRTGNLR
jgi:hypothetical protein